ncbi:IST1 homolog isoform X2 [Eurytemora carolleeae]|uniref:IST1 homolog isoform X2 n=1 Tax=Eurytemora carolleeae TaxID=1294199 RepID=UPI000C762194|nr:IST1 homolog isoform X2 [Eurytemora carolleeae]|eukprot:XP_023329877.1 IST1 homolog isoform X2 [Eurytemora affinis]
MFSSGANYNKLKTNLRLSINRLKLLEKKKAEMAMKSRKEIADYLGAGKVERAKIRVEHIIREDYMVEAMEILEMYCDLLLARFGLIQQMKTLDDGLAEAISSLIWVAPRMMSDVQELKIVAEQFAAKYGKPYAQACRENAVTTVSAKLMHKLSVQAPPKITVEKYLIEIARYYNVEYEPDPQVMNQDEIYSADNLIDLMPGVPGKNDLDTNTGNTGGGGGGGGGFVEPGYPPPYTSPAQAPFNYPSATQAFGGGGCPGAAGGCPGGLPGEAAGNIPPPPNGAAPPPPFNYNIPPGRPDSPNENVESKDDLNISGGSGPPPYDLSIYLLLCVIVEEVAPLPTIYLSIYFSVF